MKSGIDALIAANEQAEQAALNSERTVGLTSSTLPPEDRYYLLKVNRRSQAYYDKHIAPLQTKLDAYDLPDKRYVINGKALSPNQFVLFYKGTGSPQAHRMEQGIKTAMGKLHDSKRPHWDKYSQMKKWPLMPENFQGRGPDGRPVEPGMNWTEAYLKDVNKWIMANLKGLPGIKLEDTDYGTRIKYSSITAAHYTMLIADFEKDIGVDHTVERNTKPGTESGMDTEDTYTETDGADAVDDYMDNAIDGTIDEEERIGDNTEACTNELESAEWVRIDELKKVLERSQHCRVSQLPKSLGFKNSALHGIKEDDDRGYNTLLDQISLDTFNKEELMEIVTDGTVEHENQKFYTLAARDALHKLHQTTPADLQIKLNDLHSKKWRAA